MAKVNFLKLFLLLFFLFFNLYTFAQVKITGTVIDEENNPLEFVNVVLFQPDSTFLTGGTSVKNGKFTIEKVDKGDYFLTISYVGYEKASIEINEIDKDLNLGSIKLINSELLLDDVTITANSVIKKTDRQIIIPSKAQINTSNNGISLLRHLQLSRITINPIENTITALGGGNVQLRLNGLEVTQVEIMAIDPKDIVRIEYHDDPGLRYNNAEAVLDFVTKRKESGGSIMTSLINAISDVGWGENNLSAKYNYKKSEFSTNFYWGRRSVKWTRENYDTYIFPDKILERIEAGEPTKAKYDNLNFALNYSMMETDKYLFNIRLRNNYNNTPNSTGDRISSLVQEKEILSIYDHSSARANTPSLDLYYQRNLKNNQLIIFNAVGTYIDSENKRTYRETVESEVMTDIYSKISGDKYSLITEGIYEKNMQNGKVSGGIKHTQTYTKNVTIRRSRYFFCMW